jgi:hypothetical protein
MHRLLSLALVVSFVFAVLFSTSHAEVLGYHTVVLDRQNKILPWYAPIANAYDQYLRQLWNWLLTVPNGPNSSLPMYFLYCGFNPGTPITADTWENDWGERLPNWVEFGRLYYAYKGDMVPLNIAKSLVDYSLDHATTPSNFAWPNFPIGTADAGDTEIDGHNVAWQQWDVLIDLASDMGMSFYKMYLIYGDPRYRTAAVNTADVLASKIQPGDADNSPWPYVVNARTGAVRSRYCSNWAGALTLFDLLIDHNEGNVSAYQSARQMLKDWILRYPMQNGNWVDGHSDNYIDGTGNWSNTTKSNMNLYLLDHPDFDPNFMTDVPKLLKWTEDNFVYDGGSLAPVYYGAYVVSEQFNFREKMGYQTSRLAAEYAAWYAITGDSTYKDRAYRGFNYSTYMMNSNGEAQDGPKDIGNWWSDCYGEGPRMFFYGFMAVPEWAPPSEDHILYSVSILKNVSYSLGRVQYTPTNNAGIEYLRLSFLPATITVNGVSLALRSDLNAEGYTVRDLGGGDYVVNIRRARSGDVVVSAGAVTTYTIKASAGTGGTISPSGDVTVIQGANQTFIITPGSGYGVADVRVDGTSVGAVKSYTFSNVSSNHTIAASFSSAPSPPTNVQASDGTYLERVQVTWSASSGATSYTVYRATSTKRWAKKTTLGTTSETFFNDTTAVPMKTYYYYVKASNVYGTSNYSLYDAGYRSDGRPPIPTNVAASDGIYPDRVQVTWVGSAEADSYTVYRARSIYSWVTKTVLGTTSNTTFEDTTLLAGKTYYYWVKASNSYGTSDFSAYDAGYR